MDTDFASKWGQNNQHVNAGCPLFVPDSVAYAIMPMNSGKDYKARETEVAQPIMAAGPVGGNQGGDYIVQPTIAIQDVRGIDKAQNGKGWSDEGTSYTVDTRATQGVSYPVVTPFDTTQITSPTNRKGGDGGGNPPAVAYDHPGRFNNIHGGSGEHRDVMPTLEATNPKQIVASFQPTADCLTAAYGTKWNGNASATNGSLFAEVKSPQTGVFYGGQSAKAGSIAYSNEVSPTLKAGNSGTNRSPSAHIGSAVRRLTPVECERLQGFPDNFTAIPWKKKGPEQCPDGPRYKALGNSMAVPVMRWIGERIQLVDDLISVL